ncbi:MAG: VWA domain-containing protein [Acidobacteria bacterium]|nr:MAG: VWA domain-containing protein [Acidobacteriota bacterium]
MRTVRSEEGAKAISRSPVLVVGLAVLLLSSERFSLHDVAGTPHFSGHHSGVQSGTESTEVVKLRADLVTVVVTVSDATGNLMQNLNVEDFEILEDGIPQVITTFSRNSETPLSLVMILDASLSVKNRLRFEKEAFAAFLRAIIRPIDRVAIFSVSTDVALQQGFTGDIDKLLFAISHVSAQGATALYDAIATAAELLKTRPGRRVIIILSDGRDTISRLTLTEALRRVQEADAVIYAINTSLTSMPSNQQAWPGQQTLDVLCRQTGGEAFFPRDLTELNPIFDRLANELRMQYVLGFISSNERRDGSYRRLTVRIKKPGVTARARAGYYAPKQ